MKIQLKRSNQLEFNKAKQPTSDQMEYGELAVNYNTDDPAIFIKDSSDGIIRIAGVGATGQPDWNDGDGDTYDSRYVKVVGDTMTGNLGIGIAPQYPLDVNGNIRFGTATGGYALAQYGRSATGTNNWHVGSEGDGTFRFYNGTLGSGVEHMRLLSDGKTGINTQLPESVLSVRSRDSLGATAGDSLDLFNTQANTSNYDILKFSVERTADGTEWNTASHRICRKVDISDKNYIEFGRDIMAFGLDVTEYARFNPTGRFLLGTTETLKTCWGTANGKLAVAGDSNPQVIGAYDDNQFGARLDLIKSRSDTPNGQEIVQQNDELGVVYFGGSDGTDVLPGARISAISDGTPGTSNMPTRLVFGTTPGGSGVPEERFVIGSEGNASFTGKVTSASTVSADSGTTLVTKDYVDANSGGGLDPAGFVTLDTDQTITGAKTFSGHYIKVDGGKGLEAPGSLNIKSGADQPVIFRTAHTQGDYRYYNSAQTAYSKLRFENLTVNRTFHFPDKNGTIALIDDIPNTSNFVTLDTAQTITGQKTFNETIKTAGNTGLESAGILNINAGGDKQINFRTKDSSGDYRFFKTNESIWGALRFNDITQTRNYNFPNKGGTIALTDDVFSGSYNDLTDKPSQLAPTAHDHSSASAGGDTLRAKNYSLANLAQL